MIELFSTEFWIAILFCSTFFLVVFLFILVKKVNRLDIGHRQQIASDNRQENGAYVSQQATGVIDLLEPLVKESRKAAISFDEQVKEKKRLLKELNDALDTRIININLLLSRTEALQNGMEKRQNTVPSSFSGQGDTAIETTSEKGRDQQKQIIELYDQSFDIDGIAQRLSIPKGEVQLVIDLKKKFIAMERNSE